MSKPTALAKDFEIFLFEPLKFFHGYDIPEKRLITCQNEKNDDIFDTTFQKMFSKFYYSLFYNFFVVVVHCKYLLSIYRRFTVKRRYGTANDSALSLAVGCYCQGTGTIQLMTVLVFM